MNDIIDIDTGTIIEGEETIEQAGERILNYIIDVANGDVKAKAEATLHDDFIPWKKRNFFVTTVKSFKSVRLISSSQLN